MSLFQGWTIVTMPSTPAPKEIEPEFSYIVGISISPFTGEQQTQDWGGHAMSMVVTMPSMTPTDGAIWRDFLISLKGQKNVFQFSNATVLSLIPSAASTTGYWRLKDNSIKWGISKAKIYSLTFSIREAK